MKGFIIGILVLFQGIHCLYFKRHRYKLCPTTQTNQILIDSSQCEYSTLNYTASNDVLTIDSNGVISIKNNRNGVNKNVTVEATCMENSKVVRASIVIDVVSCDLLTYVTLKDRQDMLCFDGSDTNITISENIAPSILGRLSIFSAVNAGYTRDYHIVEENLEGSLNPTYLKVDPVTSELTLQMPLDREYKDKFKFKIQCMVSFQQNSRNITSDFSITVMDQNDNPPLSNGSQITVILVSDDETVIKRTVMDKDNVNCSQFSIEVFGDTLDICHPIPSIGWYIPDEGSFCQLHVNILPAKVPLPGVYTCDVAFIDVGYLLPTNGNRSDRIIFELKWIKDPNSKIDEKNDRLQLRVDKNVSKLAQIYRFPQDINKTKYLMDIPKHGLDVTVDGIVYVNDVDTLRRSDAVIKITVTSDNMKTDLFISVVGQTHSVITDTACNQTCSRFIDERGCKTGCGLGTFTGKCTWRPGSGQGIVSTYATCSPNLDTCPDKTCDTLELAFPLLCPQDCTRIVFGTGKLNSRTHRGIQRGTSPCWCDYNGECTCFDQSILRFTTPNILQYGNQTHVELGKADKNQTIDNVRVESVLDDNVNKSNRSICNTDCKITIATICGCICALVILFVIVWKTRRFKCQKPKNLKHVGSSASMSVIPSDYFDDRDYRTNHSSPQCGPYYKESFNGSVSPEDAKWEIDREHLQLDSTLGEGEFGKVVKAKAFNLDGKQSYTEVAVKMLKNCASNVEQQALWSEFNLLKDVQHPNVIRLLGACTQNGPTFIIVEYCQHGSLLSYLRNSRLEENGYVNQRYKPTGHSTNQHREPPELLTIRDLLSFAWQTAKGMKYLSEIKLVHRDLAARNILVGSGKVLKISDFGLTRDVYEADTYLKQSKGRIPVKWLAPESLYAQIYTTQSDVWSFGIVLWEIVTLGAPPYPGVPPERLYNLLLAGYRMDRPENCSDELYAVMQKCWKTDPQDRPTFSKLADIFDKMLQQRTEYLELTGGFEDDNSDLFSSRYAPSVSEISIVGHRVAPVHFENTPGDSRGSCSSYLTPALTGTLDSSLCLSDMTSLKLDSSETSEMASLLTESGGKNAFVNESMVTRRAEQTVV